MSASNVVPVGEEYVRHSAVCRNWNCTGHAVTTVVSVLWHIDTMYYARVMLAPQ